MKKRREGGTKQMHFNPVKAIIEQRKSACSSFQFQLKGTLGMENLIPLSTACGMFKLLTQSMLILTAKGNDCQMPPFQQPFQSKAGSLPRGSLNTPSRAGIELTRYVKFAMDLPSLTEITVEVGTVTAAHGSSV